ncbi:hypothetical protein [Tunicatimonas pelagia]|uniref:hypothetical protein n=1 Tax=Tunicatimonas pelagia TaxID=931531 RepID=UPI002665D4EC|nr:hypothetical protein [Tunicatimonas pelagia]WKN42349.1 hypothetical protein P0M28_25265 [Tunicatimonas pelagia]
MQKLLVLALLLLPFSCMEQDEVACERCDPPQTIDCGEDGCDGNPDPDAIVAEYMLDEVVVTATPLNSSSPKTTSLGGGVFHFSGGSWGAPFPSSYSSPAGTYTAAKGTRSTPYQPRNDAPRNLPTNPEDGAVVYVRGKDGTVTPLVYNKEYGAWVMPELIKAVNDGDIEIQLNEPVYGGLILLALPAGAVPGGQILLAGTAVVVGAVAIYNLAQWYADSHTYYSKGGKRRIWPDQYGTPPNVKDIDWSKGNQQLADEISERFGDGRRGPRSPNNLVKKWLRDHRP